MTNLNFLFLYFKKIGIHIDKKEFIIQYESQPNYPSLLAVSDTLNFFNIENGAIHIETAQISKLPLVFLTKLKGTTSDSLTFVEKEKNSDFYNIHTDSKKYIISEDTLLEKWKGIVFLIENDITTSYKKRQFTYIHFLILCSLLAFLIVFKASTLTLASITLGILSCIGFGFSLFTFQNIFTINSNLLNAVCNHNSKVSSCNAVLHSSKKLSILSDLSIVFFSYQFISFLISGHTHTLNIFLSIQKVLLFISLPVIAFSIFYQVFKLKKICTICVSISIIILLEFIILFFTQEVIHFQNISFQQYNLHIFIFLTLFIGWHFLKNILLNSRKMQVEIVQANRFKRSYTIFKNILTSSPVITTPLTCPLSFGNPNANLTIDFITSPFCGFCKKPSKILRELLKKYDGNIIVRFVYNVSFKNRKEISKHFLNQLLGIHEKSGNTAFFEALDFWNNTKDEQKWLQKYQHDFQLEGIQNILQSQRSWCIENELNFTPVLIINGYLYPKQYKIEELTYFIDDLIEDTTILEKAEVEKLAIE